MYILKGILLVCIVFLCIRCGNPTRSETKSPIPVNVKEHAHTTPMSVEDSAAMTSRNISVGGDVESELLLNVDSLKAMKTAVLRNFKLVCQNGKRTDTFQTMKGVLLKDVLNKAGIKQLNHKDRNFFIVARATDNYKATFSWAEIFNNPTGENTYVLYEENGMPIRNRGDMILVCANDINTGPRHVIWLKQIEVTRVH